VHSPLPTKTSTRTAARMSHCLSLPVSLKSTSKPPQHKSQDKILAKRIVRIAARIFRLGKKTENTENEKSTNPLIINPLLHKKIKKKKKKRQETEVVHSPSCFQKPTPTNAKQKAELIEQKQTLINQRLATATTNLKKRIRRRSFWFGFFLVGSKTLTCGVVCFFHITLRAWTLIISFSEMLKISKGIFLAMKKAFL
jgi:hypothetical protein